MNSHVAYGLAPVHQQDPNGLFLWDSSGEWWRDTKEGAGLLWNGFQTFTAMTDVHGLVQNVAESLLDNYAMNLEADADWATDWSMPDDGHTRVSNKWVTEAMLLGAHKHFNLDYWEETFALKQGGYGPSDGPVLAGVADVIKLASGGIRQARKLIGKLRSGMIFESYSLARAMKAGTYCSSLYQAHHILPKSWAAVLKLDTDGPAVLLTKAMHQPFTKELNASLKIIKKTSPALRKAKALEELGRIYANKPEWMSAIDHMFK
jgi:hypothetical protein